MKWLEITTKKLAQSHLMIQGFNQMEQLAISIVHLELIIIELSSNTLIHVIDAKTSYNVLLRQPWLHENGIILLILHWCFKFYKG